ncbi:MAG: heparan N-sulfatase [Planctomycetota bacterium]|nr:MAG: heparan N-sulfatase [Planctomycetota bacterium]
MTALAACILGLGVFGGIQKPICAADRPNILIIIADDATYSDLPLYGGKNVQTPNIDRLGSQGLVFDQAFVTEAMCQPCRSELYTGLYPIANGCCWNHSASRTGVRSMPHYLTPLGYRVGLAGKVHVRPKSVFPFEDVPGLEPNCVSPTVRFDLAGCREFVTRNDEEPFCLVTALVVPHVVWTAGDPSHFDPESFDLPPHVADTPVSRQDFARYLAEIEVLDQQVGEILKMLDETGHAEDTIVVFTSEQGAQFPGCKWTVWNQGVHTALIVRWPGKVKPGRRTAALVQYADVLPTLLDAVGADYSREVFDGRSFLPVLLGQSDEHREYAFFMHNNVPEGPPYPIRGVTDGKYRYVRNLLPDRIYIEKHVMGVPEHNPYWNSWLMASAQDEATYRLIERYMRRPAEELYCTQDDPFEMTNLASDPKYAEVKQRLSRALDRWLAQQRDPGACIDSTEQLQAARRGRHFIGTEAERPRD